MFASQSCSYIAPGLKCLMLVYAVTLRLFVLSPYKRKELTGTLAAFSMRIHLWAAAYTHQLYFTSMCFAKRPGFTETTCS